MMFSRTLIALVVLTNISYASPAPSNINKILVKKFEKNYKSKSELMSLQKETLTLAGKSVPSLITVMKSSKYPDKNRWVATFLLGKIMGKKSGPFLAKFLKHPHWVMRMASLKTLLALKDSRYEKAYSEALKDNSLLVRSQALENIKRLNLSKYSSSVWAMLYDKKNYHEGKKGRKRGLIIKKVVRTIGDLKFKKAINPLFSMIRNKRYADIFEDIDYSLSKITGKKSPNGSKQNKMRFWRKTSLKYKTI